MLQNFRVVKAGVCALIIFSLLACDKDSDDKTSKDGKKWTDSSSQRQQAPASINMAELTDKRFSLRDDLSFTGASVHRYKQFQGTSLETETIRYSYFFRHGQRISLNEAMSSADFCEVFVEASPSVPAKEIFFSAHQQFTQTSNMQSFVNGKSSFMLSLQASVFKHVMLRCQNVASLMTLNQHVGNVFSIEPLIP